MTFLYVRGGAREAVRTAENWCDAYDCNVGVYYNGGHGYMACEPGFEPEGFELVGWFSINGVNVVEWNPNPDRTLLLPFERENDDQSNLPRA